MATTADFKNGMCLDIDGNYFFIVEFLHVKPGKGPAFVRTKLKNVKTGQVTYAVRDTVIDDKEIKKDDFMGIGDQGIVAVGTDMVKVTRDMIAELVDEDSELISVYYGCDVAEDAAEALRADLEEAYPACDIELQYGGQPIYYYTVSVE